MNKRKTFPEQTTNNPSNLETNDAENNSAEAPSALGGLLLVHSPRHARYGVTIINLYTL